MQAPIPIDQLRDFIAYARNNCHPALSPEAATDIIDGYMNMRRMGSSRKVLRLYTPIAYLYLFDGTGNTAAFTV